MSNGHGGYRRPAHPAAASGPGALSRRTDGRQPAMSLPDAKYGEQQAFQTAQQAAPMSESGGAMPTQGFVGPDLSQVVPMGAPTQNPAEDIMAGMPMGAGPGSQFAPQQPTMDPATAQKLRAYVPVLVVLASQDDSSPATKQFVRQLRAELG